MNQDRILLVAAEAELGPPPCDYAWVALGSQGRHEQSAKSDQDNALVLDMLGNVAETATSNIFLAKDGVVKTPVPNGTFLNGITRQRVIGLLRQDGVTVEETSLRYSDFEQADEIFSSGNYSKVVPVGRIDNRQLQPGPLYRKARELYMDFASSKTLANSKSA